MCSQSSPLHVPFTNTFLPYHACSVASTTVDIAASISRVPQSTTFEFAASAEGRPVSDVNWPVRFRDRFFLEFTGPLLFVEAENDWDRALVPCHYRLTEDLMIIPDSRNPPNRLAWFSYMEIEALQNEREYTFHISCDSNELRKTLLDNSRMFICARRILPSTTMRGFLILRPSVSTPGYAEGNGDINPVYGTLYCHGMARCSESDDVIPDDATDIGSMSPLPPKCSENGNVMKVTEVNPWQCFDDVDDFIFAPPSRAQEGRWLGRSEFRDCYVRVSLNKMLGAEWNSNMLPGHTITGDMIIEPLCRDVPPQEWTGGTLGGVRNVWTRQVHPITCLRTGAAAMRQLLDSSEVYWQWVKAGFVEVSLIIFLPDEFESR